MQLHSTDRVNTDTKIPNSCQWQVYVCVHYSLTDYHHGHAAHGASAPLCQHSESMQGTEEETVNAAAHTLPSGAGNPLPPPPIAGLLNNLLQIFQNSFFIPPVNDTEHFSLTTSLLFKPCGHKRIHPNSLKQIIDVDIYIFHWEKL